MPEQVDHKRRKLLATAALSISSAALTEISLTTPSKAAITDAIAVTDAPGKLKSVPAGVLDIGYYEYGPSDGAPVVLMHGFPYDIHAYAEVAPILAARGCRVFVPYQRGFGTTRYRDSAVPRSGEQAALAADLLAFLDALAIPSAILGGYDWGARSVDGVAALWPNRCSGLVSVNSYGILDPAQAMHPTKPHYEALVWFMYYFQIDRGRAGLAANREELAKLQWKLASPTWRFDDATFERTAPAFYNPDFVDTVIHSYRHRFGLVEGDPAYAEIGKRLASQPKIMVPTVTLDGADDAVTQPSNPAAPARPEMFTARRTHYLIPGAGHNLPQEAPHAFADAVMTLVAAAC
jgi:pimeloyl-ACP methyl ester carboxylesterase